MFATLRSHLRDNVFGLAARSEWAAGAIFMFNSTFRREAWAVAQGIVRMRSSNEKSVGWLYTLRAWVHVIEKGITATDRRSVFGVKYIPGAVDMFVNLVSLRCQAPNAHDELYRWSRDVLREYFDVVGHIPEISEPRRRFEKAIENGAHETNTCVPYVREASPLQCDYNAMIQLAERRRSIRNFLPKRVPREELNKAMAVAIQSPSACNQQPFHFRFYDDPAMIACLQKIPMGITCFSNVPCLLVLTGDLRGIFQSVATRHVIYIDAALAAMAFQFGLESLGLSSCCINWSDLPDKEKQLTDMLELPSYERVIMFMVIGYADPAALVARSEKRSVEEMSCFNHVGEI